MKNTTDTRWIQRLENYNKALKKLNEAVEYIKQNTKLKIVKDDID